MGKRDTRLHTESSSTECERLIRNLRRDLAGAAFENTLVDQHIRRGFRLIIDGLGICLSEIDQIGLRADKRHSSLLKRLTVAPVGLVNVALVSVNEEKTIAVIHLLHARFGGCLVLETLLIDLLLNFRHGLASGAAESDEDMFLVCHYGVIFMICRLF